VLKRRRIRGRLHMWRRLSAAILLSISPLQAEAGLFGSISRGAVRGLERSVVRGVERSAVRGVERSAVRSADRGAVRTLPKVGTGQSRIGRLTLGDSVRTLPKPGIADARVSRGASRNAARTLPKPGIAGSRVGRGTVRSVTPNGGRQVLGPLHAFRRPVTLERFTRRPRLDVSRGLARPHSYFRRVHPGRPPSAPTARRELAIRHSVTHRELLRVQPGTKYHERPVRGGKRSQREVILENHVPPKTLVVTGALQGAPKGR